MTNKKQLQIKDEGYISDNSLSRNNRNKKNSLNKSEQKKIQELEKEVKFWSQTANNHLSNLQREQAENENLKEEIKELKKQKPTKTQQELEKALQETNQKIRDQEQTIQELETEKEEIISQAEQTRNEQADIIIKLEEQLAGTIDNLLSEQLQEQNREHKQKISKLEGKIKEQEKTIEELKNKPENTDNSQREQKLFTCHTCQRTLSYKLIRLVDKKNNQICRDCANSMLQTANQQTGEKIVLQKKVEPQEAITNNPEISQKNEYDLLTPELWDKYPYSEADEILELEFGIKKKET